MLRYAMLCQVYAALRCAICVFIYMCILSIHLSIYIFSHLFIHLSIAWHGITIESSFISISQQHIIQHSTPQHCQSRGSIHHNWDISTICTSIYLAIHTTIYLSIDLSIYNISIYLPLYISTYQIIDSSIYSCVDSLCIYSSINLYEYVSIFSSILVMIIMAQHRLFIHSIHGIAQHRNALHKHDRNISVAEIAWISQHSTGSALALAFACTSNLAWLGGAMLCSASLSQAMPTHVLLMLCYARLCCVILCCALI